jgi:hypothetical protein
VSVSVSVSVSVTVTVVDETAASGDRFDSRRRRRGERRFKRGLRAMPFT